VLVPQQPSRHPLPAGGQALYTFSNPQPASAFKYKSDFGAQLLTTKYRPFASGAYYDLDLAFYSAGGGLNGGTLQECYRITKLIGTGITPTTTYTAACPAVTAQSDYSLLTNKLAPAFAPSPLQKWRYFNAGKKALSVKSWTALAYDDSAWSVGASPLGYGAANVTYSTQLAINSDFKGKAQAFYYFRTVLCLASDVVAQVGPGPRGARQWTHVGACSSQEGGRAGAWAGGHAGGRACGGGPPGRRASLLMNTGLHDWLGCGVITGRPSSFADPDLACPHLTRVPLLLCPRS
jgi:hypothetical protein